MEESQQIFPRQSAFELLLARVYSELWELDNDDPGEFANRVHNFVDHWFPWQDELIEKFPELKKKLASMHSRQDNLRAMKKGEDSFTQDHIDTKLIPEEEADYAREVWRAVREILKDKGFDFPIQSPTSFFDPSGGKKSGMSKRKGFPSKLPDVVK